MLKIYILGVIASMLLVIFTLIRNKFWEDFEHCVSKAQAIGMCIGVFIGFLAYSLFSWIAFCDMFYNEYIKEN